MILWIILVFVTFVAYVWVKYGILDSISASWYALGKKSWLFTLFLWSISLPLCVMGNAWFVVAGACLCFTGAAAAYKQKMTNTVHYIGAVGGITLSLAGLIQNGIWWPAVAFAITAIILRRLKLKNLTWWVEVAAFWLIIGGLAQQNYENYVYYYIN